MRHPPVGDHNQAPRQTEAIPGQQNRSFIRQVFGNLFEAMPDKAMKPTAEGVASYLAENAKQL